MITVYYMYRMKHAPSGTPYVERNQEFNHKESAMKFIKYVVGKRFDGYVTQWLCDDILDSEWLNYHCSLTESFYKG